ncbi:MAG TPA: aspartate aminotransferase family protein [Anaeromyxobacteraceae bacterium]|jgi:acetylornithine/N-succinyldiaminopimelate aminotransferase|nr:aspartate aminotransferase family protein [Anaeromyxobacteraceae bacterium]
MKNEQLVARGKAVLTPNYRQAPLALVRGEGSRVWDADGKEYLDCICGIAVNALGHCHPALVAALEAQGRELWHVSNLFFNPRAVELAEALLEGSLFAKRVFFCNSGAEANEAMLKLARKYQADRGHPERNEIVACVNSFHGRTMFALTCTGQPKYHHGFEPLVPGVRHVPYGDLAALEQALGSRTAAFLVEPIQGEAGVMPAPAGYLAAARELTRKVGALLCFDEVQTGVGRTGRMWAHEWDGVAPDLMSAAKALANGFPMGALLASEEVGSHLTPGSHASTFGGNALGCAVALATLKLLRGGVLEASRAVSARLVERLEALRSTGRVAGVRGRGMLQGVLLQGVAAGDVVELARARGLLVNAIGDAVVRFAPALTLTAAEADLAAERLGAAIQAAPAKG